MVKDLIAKGNCDPECTRCRRVCDAVAIAEYPVPRDGDIERVELCAQCWANSVTPGPLTPAESFVLAVETLENLGNTPADVILENSMHEAAPEVEKNRPLDHVRREVFDRTRIGTDDGLTVLRDIAAAAQSDTADATKRSS